MADQNSYITELTRIFKTTASKHEAHYQSRKVLEDIPADPAFITAVLRKHLSMPDVLKAKNYPVVSLNIELNPYYHLMANCWIPLPNRETNISTKAIHHHGNMLLTTVTVFGPGYDHWLFTTPTEIDPIRELYSMEVADRRLHSLHDIAFVDAYVLHLPLYPEALTITLVLWSSKEPTTWKDRLKRISILKRNERALKQFAVRAGLAKQFDLKIGEYFDFYPVDSGFKGMRERVEYKLGPNEDYLRSLFHVLQQTGNDRLAPLVEEQLESDRITPASRHTINDLLRDLRSGRPIEGRLSECHLGIPHLTFTPREIEQAMAALRVSKDSQLPADVHVYRQSSAG